MKIKFFVTNKLKTNQLTSVKKINYSGVGSIVSFERYFVWKQKFSSGFEVHKRISDVDSPPNLHFGLRQRIFKVIFFVKFVYHCLEAGRLIFFFFYKSLIQILSTLSYFLGSINCPGSRVGIVYTLITLNFWKRIKKEREKGGRQISQNIDRSFTGNRSSSLRMRINVPYYYWMLLHGFKVC